MFGEPIHLPSKNSDQRLCDIDRKLPNSWVEDSLVSHCQMCQAKFTMWKRRHHCRVCGNIFCDSCCVYTYLPPVIAKTIPESPIQDSFLLNLFRRGKGGGEVTRDRKARVCKGCNGNMVLLLSSKVILTAINAMISRDFITIPDLNALMCTATNFHNAIASIKTRIHNLRHILPFDVLSVEDINILYANRMFLKNHSTMSVLCRKAKIIPGDQECNCRILGCGDECSPVMSVSQGLEILTYYNQSDKKALYAILDEPFDTLVHYMSAISLLPKNVITIVSKHMPLKHRFTLWYRVNVQSPEKAKQLLKTDKELSREISNSAVLWNLLWKITKKPKKRGAARRSLTQGLRVPGMWDLVVKDVLIHQIQKKKSKSCPTIIPLLTIDNRIVKILIKEDCDILSDCVVMDNLQLLSWIFQREGHTAEIQTYRVVPIDSTRGIVEIVDKAVTLRDIQKREQTVQNFMIHYNPDEPSSVLRKRFIGSLAASTIASMVLGINDRHSGNILITTRGVLFHIDFEFLLSHKPRNLKTMCSGSSSS